MAGARGDGEKLITITEKDNDKRQIENSCARIEHALTRSLPQSFIVNDEEKINLKSVVNPSA